MRIEKLHIKHIGPFIEGEMEFCGDSSEKPPVVLITGENGTGKSIILDAIRLVFGVGFAGRLERDIRRKGYGDKAWISLYIRNSKDFFLETNKIAIDQIAKYAPFGSLGSNSVPFSTLPEHIDMGNTPVPNWVVDYWRSVNSSDSFKIESMKPPQHRAFLINSLSGVKSRSSITQLMCHFDYLRDSRSESESALGEYLYKLLERIVSLSLLDGGRLLHVSRTTYDPVVFQNGHEVALSNFSGGNLYLVQNMVSLLGRMYSAHILNDTPVEEINHAPGILLIDEAENQLHPKWQKRLFSTILEIFPNLQIIATTHSPFIIASVPNAKLFVCKSQGDHSIVVDETAEYSNKPVDEILMSPLFEGTKPFNQEISHLMDLRERAIAVGDIKERRRIEEELQARNPSYFAYFDVDRALEELLEDKA